MGEEPEDEKVPIFGTWSRIYVAVVVVTAVAMSLIALFQHWSF
jgi:hypothetical protein